MFFSLIGLIHPLVTQKPKESFKPWSPSPKEIQALEGAEPIPCQGELIFVDLTCRIFLLFYTGRRGLLNLGQTCFFNVVLQCLVHNPLLRNYFLSDKHNCRQCKIQNCTSCEMDKLFTEVVLILFFPSFITSTKVWLQIIFLLVDIFRQLASVRPSDILGRHLENICRALRLCTTGRARVFYLYSKPNPFDLTWIHKYFMQLHYSLHIRRPTSERRQMRAMS